MSITITSISTLFTRTSVRYLALVCLLRHDGSAEKHGLIDYNFQCFRSAIQEVFEIRRKGAERS
jgi:Ras-related GTP-binding protein C/D